MLHLYVDASGTINYITFTLAPYAILLSRPGAICVLGASMNYIVYRDRFNHSYEKNMFLPQVIIIMI